MADKEGRDILFATKDETKKGSDLSRAFSEDGKLKTHVGGAALLEGVMMRGKYNWAVAVREPEGGIYLEEHDLASGKKKNSWMYWPLVRGCTAMCESLVLSFKALEIAAQHAFSDEEDEKEGFKDDLAKPSSDAQAPKTPNKEACASASAKVETFSWERDFGRPDTVIDALGAQRTLEPICPPEDDFPLSEECNVADNAAEENTDSSSAPEPALDALTEPAAASPTEPAAPNAAGSSASVANAAAPSAAASNAAGSDASVSNAAAPGAAASTSEESASSDEEPFFSHAEMLISFGLGTALGVVLFIVAPAFAANLLVGEYDGHTLLWNVVDGFARVVIFVSYLWLIGRMKDMKRMFAYHGAEHKTIHCFEHGLELTPENARRFPRLHVRCGTAFLIMVMIIAILVYTILPIKPLISAWGVPDGVLKFLVVIAVRLLFLPLIAGISYEITVKWAGSRPENPLVKVILWPGMQMQYLTTNEPDDSMLEIAIASMKAVLKREEQEELQRKKECVA